MALGIGLELIPVTITSGTSLSSSIGLGAKTLVGVAMPAGWDAAGLTFQVCVDGTTWLELYDSAGNVISPSVAAGRYIELDPVIYAGINYIKVRSGTAGVPVVQSADRAIQLAVRPV